MKQCGSCTKCCFHPAIPEMGSPAGELCDKCINHSCSIYEDRPKTCRQFECLWLQQDLVPDNLRPDKCYIMFEMPYKCSTYIGYESKVDAHKSPEVTELVQKINEAGFSVAIICMDGTNRYSLTEGQTKNEMHDDINNSIRSQV